MDMHQGMLIQTFKYCSIFIFLKQSYFSLSHLHHYSYCNVFWVTNFAVNIHVGYLYRLSSFLSGLHASVCWKIKTTYAPIRIQVLHGVLPIILPVSIRNLVCKVVFNKSGSFQQLFEWCSLLLLIYPLNPLRDTTITQFG